MDKNQSSNPLKISNRKDSSTSQVTYMKTGGIIVIGVFVICLIIFMAKGLFSNSDTGLPAGIDTGTINTNQTTPAPVEESSSSDAKADAKEDSQSEADSSSQAEDSSIPESNETAFVNQYAYLHTEPDKDAENIVCMSPNIEVTVLEKLENGYWKVTFMNIDGQKTGYVWNEYLQSSPLS